MKPPKAYSYVRFSTPEQEKGNSFDRQVGMAKTYAARKGLELDEKLTFRDLGVSAYRGLNSETGRLNDFKEAVRSGLVPKGSYLLVESLDRISRQPGRKALRALEEIVDEGVTLVTLSDQKEYTTELLDTDSTSLLMSLLIFIRANDESVNKGRRVRAAWSAKRDSAKDKPLTKICPAWLYLDEAGKFRLDTEKAKIVRRIFREALAGKGQGSIAEGLNAERIPVFGSGQYWHRSYVAKVLANPAVIGTMQPHTLEYKEGRRRRVKAGDPIENYYPAVITDETYMHASSLASGAMSPRRGRHAGAEVRNILGGLLTCAKCGDGVTRVYKGKAPKGGEYLVCSRAKAGAGCKYHAVRYSLAEAALLRDASYLLGKIPAGDSAIDDEIERAEAGLEAAETALENLLATLERGGRTATVTARIAELEQERDRLQGELRALYARQDEISGPLVANRARELKALLKVEPVDRTAANVLLRQLFSTVTMDAASGQLLFAWKHGAESDLIFSGAMFGKSPKTKRSKISNAKRNRR